MIRITPAILTSDLDTFIELYQSYTSVFDNLDIDIAEEDFVGNTTISLIDLVDSSILDSGFETGIHLMVNDPLSKLKYLLDNGFGEFKNLKIYIHQEALIKGVEEYLKYFRLGIVVKKESDLLDLNFYSKFSEVQLMTIVTGKQGDELDNNVLNRIKTLRDMGFKGVVSLDGGINLDTAPLIRSFNPDRVSVGSYFQKSSNLFEDFSKLNNILNN